MCWEWLLDKTSSFVRRYLFTFFKLKVNFFLSKCTHFVCNVWTEDIFKVFVVSQRWSVEYRPLSPSLLWYGEETLKLDLVCLISALRDFIMLGKEIRQFAIQRESGVILIFCVKVYFYAFFIFLTYFLSLFCKWVILMKLCHFSSILIQFSLIVQKQCEC